MRLTGLVLADIFLGKVARWNDAAIAKLNPGTTLPDLAITPVHRSDSSGTTYNVTDYLSTVSAEWKSKVGTGTSVDFPGGVGGKGSSGLAGILSRTKGGIGYVDAAYSIQNEFAYAAIENRAGNFTLPTTDAVAAAARTLQTVPSDNAASIVDPPTSEAQAYPISTFTYAIVHEATPKATTLKGFLTYAIGPGQEFGPALEFAPLPPKILDADRRTIARLRPK